MNMDTNSINNFSINRNRKISINICLSVIFKIASIIISFAIVPFMIIYLGKERYGIWLTILSVVSWFTISDLGLGQGLRNKLSETLGVNNIVESKEYISTAYASLLFISMSLFFISYIALIQLNFNKVFNSYTLTNKEFFNLMYCVVLLFFINFTISINKYIFYAFQKPALVSLQVLVINIIYLISLKILISRTKEDLLILSIIYFSSSILTIVLFTFVLFNKHKEIRPSVKYIKFNKLGNTFNIGIKFFITQLFLMIILHTDNMIITQILGPEEVVPYNLVQKLFNVVTMFHGGIFLNTLWSSYTNAYVRKEYRWIKKTFNKTYLLLIFISVGIIILIIFTKIIINIWIGKNVMISNNLIIFRGIYTMLIAINGTNMSLLNGLSKINLQVWLTIIAGIINIPLSIYFAGILKMGSSGVMLGSIFSVLILTIGSSIQSYKTINNELIKREY